MARAAEPTAKSCGHGGDELRAVGPRQECRLPRCASSANRRPALSADLRLLDACQQLEIVAVRRAEVEATAALVSVELARLPIERIGGKGNAACLHAPEDRIELCVADLERIVMRIELMRAIEIEVDAADLETAKRPGGLPGLLSPTSSSNISAKNRAAACSLGIRIAARREPVSQVECWSCSSPAGSWPIRIR